MLSLDKPVFRNERMLWKMIERNVILIDQDEGELMRLSEVGTEIWNSIDGKRTIGQIIEYICNIFEVKRNVAKRDTLRFIKRLIQEEIVVI